MNEYENEWRVTYAEINVNDVECDLNCFDCDFCRELEKKEEDGDCDVHFRHSFVEAIKSVVSGYITSKDDKKWEF